MTVSYCITLYNKERYIAGVLEAAMAEREATGGEILVYDDASTDRSAVLVEAIAARAPVRLLRGERNFGVFTATNVLLAAAREPYLRIIDGDDQVTRGSTRHLLEVMRRHGAILVHGAADLLGKRSSAPDFAAARSRLEPTPFRDGLRAIYYNLSMTVTVASATKAILPLPTDLRISQDLCIALRLAKRGVFAATDAVVSLSPDETINRLSRRLAAMYRDTCLIIATELAQDATPGDAAFAVRRNAARCRKYFRREAPDRLGAADKLFLARCAAALAVEPVERQRQRLHRIARIYAQDEARVLA